MLPIEGGRFRFGVSVFPSLYADALYALDKELDRIFDTSPAWEISIGTRWRRLRAGRAQLVCASSKSASRWFSRTTRSRSGSTSSSADTLRSLGNTGSGKSCTVASILQELFEKPDEHHARGATFVVLDVNGEYHQAFGELCRRA